MMVVSGVLEKGFPRGGLFIFKGRTAGLLSKIKKLASFFPLVVESTRAPWERLCPPGKVIAPRVLSFNDDGFTHFGEGLPAGRPFCFSE